MKNTLIAVFAATLALGAVCFLQWQKLATQKAEMLSVRSELEQQAREMADLQAAQKLAEDQRREATDQAAVIAEKLQARMRAEATAAKQSAAPAAASAPANQKSANDKAALGNFFSKMMEDPETRKLVREQQRMMLDQLYRPLFKQLGLTSDEATQFKDLLADNMLKGTEKAASLLSGGTVTNRAEMAAALTAEQKGFEEQLRSFLGETRYEQYQDYQQTVGERTQLNQFRQQFSGGDASITDAQSEQLLALMREEKKSQAAAGQLLPSAGNDPANMEAMLSGEGSEKLLLAQETVNQRVFERARGVLSEDQLGAFGKFQTNQLQMMRLSMNMAKKFMSPEQPTPESPAPPRP